MDVPCIACSTGPSGIEGHLDLMVQTLGDHRLSLRCQVCGTFWLRTRETAGAFGWAMVTEQAAYGSGLSLTFSPYARSQTRSLRLLPNGHFAGIVASASNGIDPWKGGPRRPRPA